MIVDASSNVRTRRGVNPIVRLFSSIRFGVVLLTAILIYASVFSALPQVRGALELTEMEAFRHWSFTLMIVLFIITLVTATIRRIRFNAINLGVLTVHSGLLIMTGGAIWYFWSKVEGDVILLSPRIELLHNGRPVRDAMVLPEAGKAWANTMPALGGRVQMAVVSADGYDADGQQVRPVTAARVRVKVGDEPPKDIDIVSGAVQPIDQQLALRFVTFEPQRYFYDNEFMALAHRNVNEARHRFAAIPNLPLHRERYLDDGYVIRDSQGRPAESKRTWPHIPLGRVNIPTGWFEHWRMPVTVDAPDLPFHVEVTGYVPYVAGFETVAAGGGPRENPAIDLALSDGRTTIRESLFALEPAASLLDTQVPVEFRWVRTAEEREELFKPLAGPHELTIEVLDPPVRTTIAIQEGQEIEVEGTPYVLSIAQLAPHWPLMSPGHEGAISPMASVDVRVGDTTFNRTVIQRFPQFSQDIDDAGKRHTDALVDSNLVLRYRTSADGWVMIAAGPDLTPEVASFDVRGGVHRERMPVGSHIHVPMQGVPVHFTLHGFFREGQRIQRPVIEPLDTRRPNMDRRMSAIRLKMTGKGEHSGWSETRWTMYNLYPDTDARAMLVTTPWNNETWELVFTRMQRDLEALLIPGKLSVKFFPGRHSAESWRSDFFVAREGAGAPEHAAVYTNQTASVGRWTLFQSGASQDHWSWTILGVGNREGILAMNVGWIMITIGCLYAFYVKPALIRRRKQAARARDEARAAAQPPAETPRRQPEFAGMGT